MHDYYHDTRISKLRREQLMREAENMRLTQSMENAHERLPFYAPLLSHIGDALVNTGSALKERYSDVRDAYDKPATSARTASSTAK